MPIAVAGKAASICLQSAKDGAASVVGLLGRERRFAPRSATHHRRVGVRARGRLMRARRDVPAQAALPRKQPVPVIVINMDRSAARLAHMQAEFARTGLDFERFSAVSGADLPETVKPYFCDAAGQVASPLRPGE